MRIAIVSDIHGNGTAFEAVLADLRETAPDLILHGGDLANGGASPAEVVDRIRDLGWPGVLGNTDELLFRPESLQEFSRKAPKLGPFLNIIEDMAVFTRTALGESRMAWLGGLPLMQTCGSVALVHASPGDTWRAPSPDASDAELESTYAPLGQPVAVYGHIHRPYIRHFPGRIVANSGSVGLPYDGDRRAAYLLIEDSECAIRRVEYDVEKETKALANSGLPHSAWVAKTLRSGTVQKP